MWILQNNDAVEAGVDTGSSEYVVNADHHFVGDWSWQCYHLRLWELDASKPKGEERRLNLRFEYDPDLIMRGSWDSASPDAYYHGGGLAEELVSLASLFLRARLSLGPEVRSNGKPRWIDARHSTPLDPGLLRERTDLGELDDWFPLVGRLSEDRWQGFILAVRLYHQAIGLIEENPDLAYLNLVSSVEVLSQEQEIGDVSLRELDEGLARAVSQIEREELRRDIRDRILNREYFTKRRFRQFLVEHTDDSFWEEEEQGEAGIIEEDELPDLLNRIYDQRSRTLHSGEPFPANIRTPPPYGWDISTAQAVSHGGRRWEREIFVPYPHFFERLVNHCLKQYLLRNQD